MDESKISPMMVPTVQFTIYFTVLMCSKLRLIRKSGQKYKIILDNRHVTLKKMCNFAALKVNFYF